MRSKFASIVTFLFTVGFLANAQVNPLRVNSTIALLKDSTESRLLISSLDNFLASARKPNEENRFILESEKIETYILLDEVNGIEKSRRFNDSCFYKPYLTNVAPLKDNRYIIQVSYIATNKDTALLRASFEFIAHKKGDSFLFSSPLIENTKYWKIKKIRNSTFHYQNNINQAKAREFDNLVSSFDKKLKSVNKVTELYCCGNLIELEGLVGVQYKSDYNGRTQSVWSSLLGDKKLIVSGNDANFNEFDPHDLWHSRLSLIIPRSRVNKPVDEGCAYLYGGSWGLTWKEIFKEFAKQVASNKNINWSEIKENPVYFKTRGFDNSADYIVNALLVKKIEKEKGFEGVWELLTIGPFEKGNEKYYKTLEKLTGITRENYNEKVWELINNEE